MKKGPSFLFAEITAPLIETIVYMKGEDYVSANFNYYTGGLFRN